MRVFPKFIVFTTKPHFHVKSIVPMRRLISLSHALRHFWVAKSLFLTITFNQKKQDKTFCFYTIVRPLVIP